MKKLGKLRVVQEEMGKVLDKYESGQLSERKSLKVLYQLEKVMGSLFGRMFVK